MDQFTLYKSLEALKLQTLSSKSRRIKEALFVLRQILLQDQAPTAPEASVHRSSFFEDQAPRLLEVLFVLHQAQAPRLLKDQAPRLLEVLFVLHQAQAPRLLEVLFVLHQAQASRLLEDQASKALRSSSFINLQEQASKALEDLLPNQAQAPRLLEDPFIVLQAQAPRLLKDQAPRLLEVLSVLHQAQAPTALEVSDHPPSKSSLKSSWRTVHRSSIFEDQAQKPFEDPFIPNLKDQAPTALKEIILCSS